MDKLRKNPFPAVIVVGFFPIDLILRIHNGGKQNAIIWFDPTYGKIKSADFLKLSNSEVAYFKALPRQTAKIQYFWKMFGRIKELVRSRDDLPMWFKVLNCTMLVPVCFWPFVFFISIFFFDHPKSFFSTVLLFLLVNAYPVYLAVLVYLNSKLFKKNKPAGLILPVLYLSGTIALIVFILNKAAWHPGIYSASLDKELQ
jgi:hypothetical protein